MLGAEAASGEDDPEDEDDEEGEVGLERETTAVRGSSRGEAAEWCARERTQQQAHNVSSLRRNAGAFAWKYTGTARAEWKVFCVSLR